VNYLVKKKTSYLWNGLPSPTFEVNVGVGQESALSPILLALYFSSFLYILENHVKNLNIPVSILSFVDNGLIIAQNKSIDISNSYLFVVIIYFPNFSTVLVSSSNIRKLKYSILTNHMESSIPFN